MDLACLKIPHFKDKWNSGANLRVIPEKDKKITSPEDP